MIHHVAHALGAWLMSWGLLFCLSEFSPTNTSPTMDNAILSGIVTLIFVAWCGLCLFLLTY